MNAFMENISKLYPNEGEGLALYTLLLAPLLLCSLSQLKLKPSFKRMGEDDDEQQKHQHPQKKRMSFLSGSMAMGCMPDEINLSEPVIQALVSFKDMATCPHEDDLIPLVEKLMEAFRMSSIPTTPDTNNCTCWDFEPCPKIDLRNMIRVIDVNFDTIEEMEDIVQDQQKFELSDTLRNLPWWEFVLVKNKGNSESMLIFRVHHSIGDGLSLGILCHRIMENADGSPVEDFIPQSMKAKAQKSDTLLRFRNLKMILTALPAAMNIAVMPMSRFDHGIAFSKNVVGKHVKDTRQRKTLIFDPIPTEFVKNIKERGNMSFNDVIVTALSQAIHDFCYHLNCPVMKQYGKQVRCRSNVMIGFPSKHKDINQILHNDWVPLSLDLGVGHVCLKERINHIKKGTTELKETPLAFFQKKLMDVIFPMLPTNLYRTLVHMVFSRHSLSCTNVPGPKKEIFIAGKPVSACRFTVGNIHPVFAALSYNGHVNITLNADDKAIPDVRFLPTFFMRAMVKLGKEFGADIPRSVQIASEKILS